MDTVDAVMNLAGVDRLTAEVALAEHKEVWLAIDSLLTRPTTAGDRFLPPPPTVDDGMTPEQRELCRRGRWLQDQVNVVFSVAHSKIRSQPGQDSQALEAEAPPAELPEQTSDCVQSPPSTTGFQPDSHEQTTQPDLQSGSLQ
jgi:hypothetical protein